MKLSFELFFFYYKTKSPCDKLFFSYKKIIEEAKKNVVCAAIQFKSRNSTELKSSKLLNDVLFGV